MTGIKGDVLRGMAASELEAEVLRLIQNSAEEGLAYERLIGEAAGQPEQEDRLLLTAERLVRRGRLRRLVVDRRSGREVPAALVLRVRNEEPESPERAFWEVVYTREGASSGPELRAE